MPIASYFNLTTASVDINGRERTVEQFNYKTKDGYSSSSRSLSLVINAEGINTINGVSVKKAVAEYLASFEE